MYSVANSLSLNPHTLQLQGALVRVDITDPECRLLMAFARAGQQRLETVHMLDCVGKAIGDPGKRALEVQIVRLRKKLEQAGASGPTIKSIRGVGYQLYVPLSLVSEKAL